jgi:hypothetical protein
MQTVASVVSVSDCTEIERDSCMWRDIIALVNCDTDDDSKCVSVVTVDDLGRTKRYWVRGSRVFQDMNSSIVDQT